MEEVIHRLEDLDFLDDNFKNTLLMTAVSNDDIEMVSLLLIAKRLFQHPGLNLDLRDWYGKVIFERFPQLRQLFFSFPSQDYFLGKRK